MQRHGHDSIHRLPAAVFSPRIRQAGRQKRRQIKFVAVLEFMNPMPRLSFEGKRGNRDLPRAVIFLQLALAAFIQQTIRRPSATRATTFRQRGAFVQTVRAHLLARRKHRPTAARTEFRSKKIKDGRQDSHQDATICSFSPTGRRRWRPAPRRRLVNPVSHVSSPLRKPAPHCSRTAPPATCESPPCGPSASVVP